MRGISAPLPPFILGSAGWMQRYAGCPLAGRGAVGQLLRSAEALGLELIDSSPLYGGVEAYLAARFSKQRSRLRLISKIKRLDQPPPLLLGRYSRSRCPRLYGVLLHDFASFQQHPIGWERVLRWQRRGLIERAGFSLYYPWQLELLLKEQIEFDLLQLPFNLLDRRFSPYFPQLRKMGVELHLRSIFLQGQLLRAQHSVAPWLVQVLLPWHQLCQQAHEVGLSALDLCLGLARSTHSSMVLGLRNRAELLAALASWKRWPQVAPWLGRLHELVSDSEELIVPSLWPQERT